MLASTVIALALATAGPNVDNPYFPLPVGRQWVYREGDQRDVVTVTDRTKLIANGVVARVVRDEVTRKGVPVEITDDYYAQDAQGQRLVPRRGDDGVRAWQAGVDRGLVRGRASTARGPGSSCPPTRRSACATARSSTRATPRTARRSSH